MQALWGLWGVEPRTMHLAIHESPCIPHLKKKKFGKAGILEYFHVIFYKTGEYQIIEKMVIWLKRSDVKTKSIDLHLIFIKRHQLPQVPACYVLFACFVWVFVSDFVFV